MKDLFLASIMVICGVAGLALIHKKDGSDKGLKDEKPVKSKTILIKAVHGYDEHDESEIKVLDGNDIHISKDSTDFAFQG